MSLLISVLEIRKSSQGLLYGTAFIYLFLGCNNFLVKTLNHKPHANKVDFSSTRVASPAFTSSAEIRSFACVMA